MQNGIARQRKDFSPFCYCMTIDIINVLLCDKFLPKSCCLKLSTDFEYSSYQSPSLRIALAKDAGSLFAEIPSRISANSLKKSRFDTTNGKIYELMKNQTIVSTSTATSFMLNMVDTFFFIEMTFGRIQYIIWPFGISILLKISQPLVAVLNPIATATILSCGNENISLLP
jgi:hypothetical protein